MVVWKGSPVKHLTRGYLGSLGRSSCGSISSWHRESGHRRRFRIVDNRFLISVPGIVRRFELDPIRRNGMLALLCFANGFLSYTLAAKGSVVGSFIYPSSYFVDDSNMAFVTPGSVVPINIAPVGAPIYNVGVRASGPSVWSRAGGSGSQIIAKFSSYALVRLASGAITSVSSSANAQFGSPCLATLKSLKLPARKASKSRWLGRRPVVRGVAMNPIDHPHGGGEGKTSGGGHSVTPWGWLTKGKKTRRVRGKRSLAEPKDK